MKVPLSWLRCHLHSDAPLDAIATTLSAIGLEVDAVENRGAALAPFLTARVIEARPHPDADRLRVCLVDAGGPAPIQVVCGAPNARTGLHAVFAPPGAVIPGSGVVLKVGKIRGQDSAGMLVSARELALGDDHDGIIELPDGAPIGVPYARYAELDDPVLDIGVTPNRGDALAVRGIARDLAAAGLGTLLPWSAPAVAGRFASPIGWAIEDAQACPWVLGRAFRGLRNGPSPAWLQKRLLAIGLRPISTLVDITNYFTHDLGRPLHVFDLQKLSGPVLTIRPGRDERFAALNGRTITATADDLVIADDAGVQSLAGIVGGTASGTSPDTTTIFLECALFDPVRLAFSGRRHALATDARARFERGVDQALPPAAIEAATALILDLCGGEASDVVCAGAEPAWQRNATLRPARLASLGGARIDRERAAAILRDLGFPCLAETREAITVAVPSWRNDIAAGGPLAPGSDLPAASASDVAATHALEAECDLIEEVLRIDGLDRIEAVSLPLVHAVPRATLTPRQTRTALARRVLASRGLAEAVTYSFGPSAMLARFGDTPPALAVRNPIAADLDQLRPTPLATLIPAVLRNLARGAQQAALFEIGPGYTATGQNLICAGLIAGTPPRHWQAPPPVPDAMLAKSHVWALLGSLGLPMEALSVTAEAPAHYHPGQAGTVRQGPKIVLGHFGTLHPGLAASLGLDAPACAFELFLDAIADPKRRRRPAPDLPALQPLRRDFAFVVPAGVAAETVLRAARLALRALVADVRLFDVFAGGSLSAGERSLGVEVTLQPRERTLTDEEIDKECASIVAAVTRATGARLR